MPMMIDDEEGEEKEEKKWTERELMQLLRLRDCKKTTDVGMVDQGFPGIMREMVALGWVKSVGKGHQITNAGRIYLAENAKFLK